MNIDLNSVQRLHFIGIGGIGMSALARYFLALGKKISGSDAAASEITRELQQEGAEIRIEHAPENIAAATDLAIISNAIPARNPEVRQAKKLGIPVASYAQLLGEVSRNKYTIAVCGAHGKSTTTAMIALMLTAGGLDPTVMVGTKLKEFGHKNFRMGKSNFLVVEAGEYKRDFLHYYPQVIVITNIDPDHLDYFRDEADYVQAFRQFAKKLPHGGYLIGNGAEKNIPQVTKAVKGEYLPVIFQEKTFLSSTHSWPYPKLQVPGRHNLNNAALAFMTGKVLDIPEKTIVQALQNFSGTWRRFENKGKLPTGAVSFDDYGHHPTEIRATLQGAREAFPKKRIICVFQPHQYSRTHHLLRDFASAFGDADLIIIPDIYAARDSAQDKKKVSADILVERIEQQGKQAVNGRGLEKTAAWLLRHTDKNDVVLTMGAGNITDIYKYFE